MTKKRIADSKASGHRYATRLHRSGAALLEAQNDGLPLEMAVAKSPEWGRPRTTGSDRRPAQQYAGGRPIGSCRTRIPPLPALRAAHVAVPEAQGSTGSPALDRGGKSHRRNASVTIGDRQLLATDLKWHRHLRAQDQGDNRLREVAVLFHLRDAFRSGDIWLDHSRRYGDLKQVLVPLATAVINTRLAVPSIRSFG